MDGYQLAALHVLMESALLVHMLRTGAVQYSPAGESCEHLTGKPLGDLWSMGGRMYSVFGFVCCSTWLDYHWLKSKSYRQQGKNGGKYYYLLPVVIFANDGGVMCC